ncbi:MAG TPA: hypothetical protein DDZ51_11525, partial [Planctomycetaceae bacterium]|nr:hypothetical protein [Planctomycetaceae bacterium]
ALPMTVSPFWSQSYQSTAGESTKGGWHHPKAAESTKGGWHHPKANWLPSWRKQNLPTYSPMQDALHRTITLRRLGVSV